MYLGGSFGELLPGWPTPAWRVLRGLRRRTAQRGGASSVGAPRFGVAGGATGFQPLRRAALDVPAGQVMSLLDMGPDRPGPSHPYLAALHRVNRAVTRSLR